MNGQYNDFYACQAFIINPNPYNCHYHLYPQDRESQAVFYPCMRKRLEPYQLCIHTRVKIPLHQFSLHNSYTCCMGES